DLVAALVADADGARRLAADAPLITDDMNRLATARMYRRGRGLTADAAGRVLASGDPLQRADSVVFGALARRLSMSYIARRLSTYVALDPSERDRIARFGANLGDTPQGAYVRALSAMTGGDTDAGLRL